MACKILCILALVAVASAAPDNRLMGATPVDIQETPFVVAIQYRYPNIGINIQRCVGSLISSWHVLTTAFCFTGGILQNVRVQAGSSNSLEGGEVRAATHFLKHPDYQESPRAADIAVLFVDAPFYITPTINVAYLPSATYNLPVGTELKVVGWGFDAASGGSQLPEVHASFLNTISRDQCQQALSSTDSVPIDENSVCAAAEGKGFCIGDSGAPAVVDNMVVGVASSANCGSGLPEVLAYVPAASAWIMSVAVAPSSDGVAARAMA